MSRTILQYINHPENKFEGNIGVLKRKHVHVDGVVYIGKEANNINEQALKLKESQIFINEETLKRKILNLTPKQAREMGIKHRSTLKKIKNKIEAEEYVNLKTKTVRRLISVLV